MLSSLQTLEQQVNGDATVKGGNYRQTQHNAPDPSCASPAIMDEPACPPHGLFSFHRTKPPYPVSLSRWSPRAMPARITCYGAVTVTALLLEKQ
jgi:hypothetical protein